MLCMPKTKRVLNHLSIQDRTSNRYFFFLEYDSYYLILAAALVLSILSYFFMRICPGSMMHLTFFLSAIAEIILAVIFYLYTKQNLTGKIILATIMFITFMISFFQIICFSSSLRMNKVFLNQGKKFLSERRRIFWYIPLCMIITLAFLYLIYLLYLGGLSILPPYQVPNNIYYSVLIFLFSLIRQLSQLLFQYFQSI